MAIHRLFTNVVANTDDVIVKNVNIAHIVVKVQQSSTQTS